MAPTFGLRLVKQGDADRVPTAINARRLGISYNPDPDTVVTSIEAKL